MGIKQFFIWLQKNHASSITPLKEASDCASLDGTVDHLLIDMNGLFHSCAQYVYRYGNYASDSVFKDSPILRKKYYQCVCDTIDMYYTMVKPKKTIVLCVDGVAPVAKQNQMRTRRVRKNEHAEKGGFDSNNLSVGTEFMHNLTKFIDAYVCRKITEDVDYWGKIKVIVSNEKVCGEGEHKLVNFIRAHHNEPIVFQGLDADLIMLSLFTGSKNVHILRENLFKHSKDDGDYFLVSIDKVKESLIEELKWPGKFNDDRAIDDFVFLGFLVGNDFLPHIPCIEIVSDGIEMMFAVYKDVCTVHGHLINDCSINLKALRSFFETISQFEVDVLQDKFGKPVFMEDKVAIVAAGKSGVINIYKYREEYKKVKFANVDYNAICQEYIKGLYWVLGYYSGKNIDWNWYYPHHYAPFAFDLGSYQSMPVSLPITPSESVDMFLQLVAILPKRNESLVPECLRRLIPEEVEYETDMSGMRREWEGIVLLPFLDRKRLRHFYMTHVRHLSDRDKKLNQNGKSYVYSIGENEYVLHTNYGNYPCKTKRSICTI